MIADVLREQLEKLENQPTGLERLTLLTSDGQSVDLQQTLLSLSSQSNTAQPKIFVLGDDFSSENDLVFVNKIWKKFEDTAGKNMLGVKFT